ncbi:MAG: 50S ribosomal protein L11 methyltransferase [Desulfobacterales bacterium]|jgi:ribosomal protein L11 methyltransferase
MTWIECKVTYDSNPGLAAAELIADVFYQFGVKGVVMEDPGEPVPEDHAVGERKGPEGHSVSGFFPGGTDAIAGFETALRELSVRAGVRVSLQTRSVEDEDWAESWKVFFFPERIGSSLVVKPSWRAFDGAAADLVVDIDPGMAFGTGTHPTTRMCLCLLERHLKPGQHVLDVGTGSGILMVAAFRLGAARVDGIDIDETALAIARENLDRNKIPGASYGLHRGPLAGSALGPCDIVVANILAEVIVDLVGDIASVVRDGGLFIGSGIIPDRLDTVTRALTAAGFVDLSVETQDQWVAVTAKRHGGG